MQNSMNTSEPQANQSQNDMMSLVAMLYKAREAMPMQAEVDEKEAPVEGETE